MSQLELITVVRNALLVLRSAHASWPLTKSVAVRETIKMLTGRINQNDVAFATRVIEMEF